MIFAFFRMLKANIVLIAITIGGLLLTALKVQSARLGRAKDRVRQHKLRAERDKKFRKDKREIEEKHRSRSREIAKEIEESGTSDELTEPEW